MEEFRRQRVWGMLLDGQALHHNSAQIFSLVFHIPEVAEK